MAEVLSLEDGVVKPSEYMPVFIEVTSAGGLIARSEPHDRSQALYVIGQGRVVKAVEVKPVKTKKSAGLIRWYRVNASSTGDTSAWIRGASSQPGRSVTISVRPSTRSQSMAQRAVELDECAALSVEVAKALHEAQIETDAFAFVLRSIETLTQPLMALIFKHDVDRHLAREAAKKQVPQPKGSLKFSAASFLASLARTTSGCINPPASLWDVLNTVLAKVALLRGKSSTSQKSSALRGDIVVGLAVSNEATNLRRLLEAKYAGDTGANCRHSIAKTSALNAAARSGSVGAARVLLHFGAVLDAEDELTSFAPLHTAAMMNRTPVARLLLAKGASRTQRTYAGEEPGFLACDIAHREGHDDLARVLRLAPPGVKGLECFKKNGSSLSFRWRALEEEAAVTYRISCRGACRGALLDSSLDCARVAHCPTNEAQLNGFPTLAAMQVSVAACCSGVWGPESQEILCFTSGPKPLPPTQPRLCGYSRDHLEVDFKPGRVNLQKAAKSRLSKGSPTTVILGFEAECYVQCPPEPRDDDEEDKEIYRLMRLARREDHDNNFNKDEIKIVGSAELLFEEGGVAGDLLESPRLTISGLEEHYRCKLRFRVRARNCYGVGDWSQSSAFMVLATPHIRVDQVQPRSIELSWARFDRASSSYELIARKAPPFEPFGRMFGTESYSKYAIDRTVVYKNGILRQSRRKARRRRGFLPPASPASSVRGRSPASSVRGRSPASSVRGRRTPPASPASSTRGTLPPASPASSARGQSAKTKFRQRRENSVSSTSSAETDYRRSVASKKGRTKLSVKTAYLEGEEDDEPWWVVVTELDGTSQVVNGLEPGVHYEFRLRSLPIGVGKKKPWCQSVATREPAVRTLPLPPAPPRPPGFPTITDVPVSSTLGGGKTTTNPLGQCLTAVISPVVTNGEAVSSVQLQVTIYTLGEDEGVIIVDPASSKVVDLQDFTFRAQLITLSGEQPPNPQRHSFSLWMLPARRYELRARATNSAGTSEFSKPRVIDTPKCAPPSAPTATNRTSSSVSVRIERPDQPTTTTLETPGSGAMLDLFFKMRIIGYEVRHADVLAAKIHEKRGDSKDKQNNNICWVTESIDTDPTMKAMSIALDSLVPDSEYQVQVRCFSRLGFSAWSGPLMVKTAKGL